MGLSSKVFRGWSEKHKKMFSPEEMGVDQVTLMPDGIGFINVSGASTQLSVLLHHILPLQSIGEVDSNSKRIFEGDILLTNEAGWHGVVTFKFAAFYLTDNRTGVSSEPEWSKCEVLGNIYENPELVEKFRLQNEKESFGRQVAEEMSARLVAHDQSCLPDANKLAELTKDKPITD